MTGKRKFNFARSRILLEGLPVLEDIPDEHLQAMLGTASTTLVPAGKLIFREGEVGKDALFVTRGLVSLSKRVPPQRRVTVELVGSGEPLGVIAVMDGRPFPLEATAFIETGLLHVPIQQFQALARDHPTVVSQLYNVVGARFRKAQERMAQLVSAGARERVIGALDMLLQKSEVCAECDTIHTTRRQLAELAGVTTETCIRMTSALEQESIITFPGRKSIRVNRELLAHARNSQF